MKSRKDWDKKRKLVLLKDKTGFFCMEIVQVSVSIHGPDDRCKNCRRFVVYFSLLQEKNFYAEITFKKGGIITSHFSKKSFFLLLLCIVCLLVGGTLARENNRKLQIKHRLVQVQRKKITTHPKNYHEQLSGVSDEMSQQEFLDLQEQALGKGVDKQFSGHLRIPALQQNVPIFRGATPYTLSLGVATYFYEDAVMGKGNFVVAGHDMLMPGVLFSDLHELVKGDAMDLIDTSTIYRYRVDKMIIVPETYTLINEQPEAGSFLSVPATGEKPKLTLFTCIYTDKGKERYVVQGHLSQQFPNGD